MTYGQLLKTKNIVKIYFNCNSIVHNVIQLIERYQLSENLVLSYRGAKSKYLKIWSLGRFCIFFNPQYLLPKLLEGFDIKAEFSCKNELLNFYSMPILHPNSQIWRAFFSKSTFHWSVMTSFMKLWYLEMESVISKKFAPKLS